MLCVLDPARAEGEFVAVFEEFVAGTVGAYKAAVFRVTCFTSEQSVSDLFLRVYIRVQSGWLLEARLPRGLGRS